MTFTARIIPFLLLGVTVGCGSEGPDPADAIPVGKTVEIELPAFEAPEAAQQLTIRALDGSGRPLEGARVRFLDTLVVDPLQMERATLGIPDAATMLEGFASHARTDERGEVDFPWSGGPALVDATYGELFCLAAFEAPRDGVLVLELEAAPELVARVQGGAVPVRLFLASADGTTVTLAQRNPDPATGLVRFRDPTGGVRMPGGRDVTFSVGCAVVGVLPVREAFDPAAPPASPIELRAPETSSVWVECVDERGRPLRADGIATIEDAAAGEASVRHRLALDAGRCRFDSIAPETLLRVTIDAPGGAAPASVVEPGPLVAGGEVVVRVPIGISPGKATSLEPLGPRKGGR